MKFSCEQQTLSKALNIVSKAVTSRTTIPILKGILLKVSSDGILTMSASDLEIGIEKTLKVENFEPGEIVVQSKLFSDIIKKLPDAQIDFEVLGENLSIKCKKSFFNVICSPSDEFPKINNEEDNMEVIKLEKENFKEMIKKTSFAASIDEARGVITGVLFRFRNNLLNMVALDGFRMAVTKSEIDKNEGKDIIIPSKILNEISKIITESEFNEEDDKTLIDMCISQKKATFIIESTKVYLRLLEGSFVDYEKIIPAEHKCTLKVDKNELLENIERASLFAKIGKNNLIKFEIKNNTLEITSKSEEGDVKEEVYVEQSGEDVVIGFNSKYLIDCLKNIDDEFINIAFNSSINPCLITPLDGESYKYIVLPVRITGNN